MTKIKELLEEYKDRNSILFEDKLKLQAEIDRLTFVEKDAKALKKLDENKDKIVEELLTTVNVYREQMELDKLFLYEDRRLFSGKFYIKTKKEQKEYEVGYL